MSNLATSIKSTINVTRSSVFKKAWTIVKQIGKNLSEALKEAWASIKNMGKTKSEVEKLIDLIVGKKFNGKVYGIKTFTIYLDSEKVEITTEQADILRKTENGSLELGYGISYSWYNSNIQSQSVRFKNPDGFTDSVMGIIGKLDLINNTKLEVLASNEIEGTQYEICRVTIYSQVEYWLSEGSKSQRIDESNAQSLIEELQ